MSEDDIQQCDNDGERVVKAVAVLMEHFDAVRIFASKTMNEKTIVFTSAGGNLYAQIGMCQEFLSQQDEIVRHQQRKECDADGDEN